MNTYDYTIKVTNEMNNLLENNAKRQNVSVEKLIDEILSRYVTPVHMMDNEIMAKGYVESGDINLEWANL
ncbi:MAG: hypothetical protein FWC11_01340 [Firmicutes bacterium]|nr:hypothetical protein [Bacillota bacterium]MCL2255485.1 hypothetical protein [Bacillota bacterium]